MPPHWKVENDVRSVLKTWTIGQAVQLRESLRRLERRSQSGTWPEYSEFECYACHHNLVAADRSWRQRAGYDERRPGNPPWNAAHFAILRIIVKQTEPEMSAELEKSLAGVFRVTSDVRSDRATIATSAKNTANAANALVDRLRSRSFNAQDAQRILQALSSDSDKLANMGPKSAEQATMAIQSIAAISDRNFDRKEFDAALKALYKEIENPSNYSATQFASQFRGAISALR
jgi:hypothetical protein